MEAFSQLLLLKMENLSLDGLALIHQGLDHPVSNNANNFGKILLPQNQQLWDLGIPEQSMSSQESVNAQLEVGPGYNALIRGV